MDVNEVLGYSKNGTHTTAAALDKKAKKDAKAKGGKKKGRDWNSKTMADALDRALEEVGDDEDEDADDDDASGGKKGNSKVRLGKARKNYYALGEEDFQIYNPGGLVQEQSSMSMTDGEDQLDVSSML